TMSCPCFGSQITPTEDSIFRERKSVFEMIEALGKPNPIVIELFYNPFSIAHYIFHIFCHPFNHWITSANLTDEEKKIVRNNLPMFAQRIINDSLFPWTSSQSNYAGSNWSTCQDFSCFVLKFFPCFFNSQILEISE
ncbi:hypothetical protein PFISCL1PPCAC_25193, partial [Pristionchus fissidentatus]